MGHVWEMPDGKQVTGLREHRAVVDTRHTRWNIYTVFAPGTSGIVAVCHDVKNGRVLLHGSQVHFLAEWKSSLAMPKFWDRAEAECLMMQVLVNWFGVDVVTRDVRTLLFTKLIPFERTPS